MIKFRDSLSASPMKAASLPCLPAPNPHCGLQEEGEGTADYCTEPNYQLIFFIQSLERGRKQRKKIMHLNLHIQHPGVICWPLC